MPSQIDRQIHDLFVRALEVPPQDRHTFLAESCAGDQTVYHEVEVLLQAEAASADFLCAPALLQQRSDQHADSVIAQLLNAHVGAYQIVGHLATTAHSIVMLGRRQTPQQNVAIKFLRSLGEIGKQTARIQTEAHTLARLEHPGIVRFFDHGVWTCEPGEALAYLIVEYVPDAQDLVCFVRERKLALGERLRLYSRCCEAIEYGHRHGVLHLDLKPSNMLISGDGWPKIIDFGTARLRDRQPGAARHGTPDYMSPELASGDHDVDVRSDVYALGVVLFEVITGVDAVGARRLVDATLQHRQEANLQGAQGESIARTMPADLWAIVVKAMHSDPKARYQSVEALRQDVKQFCAHRPVTARSPSTIHALRLFAKRNPWAFVAVCAGCVALLTAMLAIYATIQRARSSRELAQQEARRLTRSMDAIRSYLRQDADQHRYASSLITRVPFGDEQRDGTVVLWPVVSDDGVPQKRLVVLDDEGKAIWQLNDALTIPSVLGAYADSEPFVTQAALVADVFSAYPGSEVVVAQHHVRDAPGVIRVLVNGQTVAAYWNGGHIYDLYWNADQGLLFALVSSNSLPAVDERFSSYQQLQPQSPDRHSGSRYPNPVVAIRPEPRDGVLSPAAATDTLPRLAAEWMVGRLAELEIELHGRWEISQFALAPPGPADEVCRVIVRARRYEEGDADRIDAFAVVGLGVDGQVVSRERLAPWPSAAGGLPQPRLVRIKSP